MIQSSQKITALYCRLSQEDMRQGDSIVNQKMILEKYAKENGFENTQVFADDGYSGVNFERPAFRRMLDLIEDGKIGVIITKDLSRLGRNYIEVGSYTEIYFPKNNVRYIAVNDNFDSMYTDGNELAPFKNLFNEWFARDTSKKIRAVKRAKAEKVNASVQDRLTVMLKTRTTKIILLWMRKRRRWFKKSFPCASRDSVRR